ncbi:Ferredoxin [Shimia gijangensis]|uniref:Ferredoxin n=1 Tax=Shimia gijangensis TaxID=1470563 RepID=A0A1M6M4L1_9RHOB|nr:4Fe-4S dicluster domain-containing protein [Shimia gijangensis]SHJ78382.1 Ferredoxin [Shimia gijangensis]
MFDLVERAAAARHLDILGGFHPDNNETDLRGFGTVLLFGPREPGFWDHFTQDKEYLDGTPNPIDRWSARVLTGLAAALNAHPFFPFTGPPYQPFYQWALRTDRCHASPINLLVHDTAGLFVSFRGALAFPQVFDLPPAADSPCEDCADKPCQTTCPVEAFSTGVYDVPACTAEMRTRDRKNCLIQGCGARRACPVSQSYGRVTEQSAFHMQVFLKNAP